MTTEQQVREARSPQEAMLAIAAALDRIEDALTQAPAEPDPWGGWQPEAVRGELRTQVNVEDGVAEVTLPPVSEAKQNRRVEFARQNLHLGDLGDVVVMELAYAKGGPMWLYLGNRQHVMELPPSVKRAMIEDVEEDSPADAHEMARDILKAPCETDLGGGMRVAEGDVG
jgi:hypothetical protein